MIVTLEEDPEWKKPYYLSVIEILNQMGWDDGNVFWEEMDGSYSLTKEEKTCQKNKKV